ncbi:hypothetical protein FRC02_003632 [Tulasnella sp. 418]|nr:hypothetical protein FRC02_003632 [Tulasnella sp. 418]
MPSLDERPNVAPRASPPSTPSKTGWIVLACLLLAFLIITPLIWWRRLRSWYRHIRGKKQSQTEMDMNDQMEETGFQARVSQLFGYRRSTAIIPDPYTPNQFSQDTPGSRMSASSSSEKPSVEEQHGLYKWWSENVLRRNSGVSETQDVESGPKRIRTRKQAIPTPSAPLPLMPRPFPTIESKIHAREEERVRRQASRGSTTSTPTHTPTSSQDTVVGSDIAEPSKIHWKSERAVYSEVYSKSEPSLRESEKIEARTAVSSTLFSSVSSRSLPPPPPPSKSAQSTVATKGSMKAKIFRESRISDFGIKISDRMRE